MCVCLCESALQPSSGLIGACPRQGIKNQTNNACNFPPMWCGTPGELSVRAHLANIMYENSRNSRVTSSEGLVSVYVCIYMCAGCVCTFRVSVCKYLWPASWQGTSYTKNYNHGHDMPLFHFFSLLKHVCWKATIPSLNPIFCVSTTICRHTMILMPPAVNKHHCFTIVCVCVRGLGTYRKANHAERSECIHHRSIQRVLK